MICCPVPGSSLGSCMSSDHKGHDVVVGDVVHVSNGFNLVNKGKQGVNVPSVKPDSGGIVCINDNVKYSGSPVKHVTKCFYRSDLDKKEIRGLIAKGNKTKALGCSNIEKIVKTRTFVATKTPYINQNDQQCVKLDNAVCVTPIVTDQEPFTTKNSPQGGANNKIFKDSIARDEKGVNLNSHPPIVGHNTNGAEHGENSSDTCIVPVQGFVEVNKDTVNTFTDTMHLNNMEFRGGIAVTGCEDIVKVFDINATNDDKFTMGLFSKAISKQIFKNRNLQCDAFRSWERLTDFHFGFIPVSDLALPQSRVIGPGFESPIEQHFQAKKHGVPNFLGARIPVKSQLNVSAWEIMLKDY